MLLDVKNLSDRKGVRYFLQNINWQVNKGEKWLVMGSNGSGKTTLASIIAGYRGYSEGEITLFSKPLTNDTAMDLRSRIGFVSSSYFDKFYQEEMGYDIVLAGLNGGLGRLEPISDQDALKAKQLLDAFGIGHRGMYPYNMLSRGQQQKILLCRGFMANTDFYIFDEPCGGLDLLSRAHFTNTVADMLKDDLLTMIYITHHTEEILLPGFTHMLLLKDGMIHASGKISQVLQDETLSAFFGKPTKVVYSETGVQFHVDAKMKLNQTFWK